MEIKKLFKTKKIHEKAKKAKDRIVNDFQSPNNPSFSNEMSNGRAILWMLYLTTLAFVGVGFLFRDFGWTGGWGTSISLVIMICMYLLFFALFAGDGPEEGLLLIIIPCVPFLLWGYIGVKIWGEWYFFIIYGVAALLPIWLLDSFDEPSLETERSICLGGILSMVSFLPLFYQCDNFFQLRIVTTLTWVLAIVIFLKYFEIIVYSALCLWWSFSIFILSNSWKAGLATLFFSILIMVWVYIMRKE